MATLTGRFPGSVFSPGSWVYFDLAHIVGHDEYYAVTYVTSYDISGAAYVGEFQFSLPAESEILSLRVDPIIKKLYGGSGGYFRVAASNNQGVTWGAYSDEYETAPGSSWNYPHIEVPLPSGGFDPEYLNESLMLKIEGYTNSGSSSPLLLDNLFLYVEYQESPDIEDIAIDFSSTITAAIESEFAGDTAYLYPSGDGDISGTWAHTSGTTGWNLVDDPVGSTNDGDYIACPTSGTSYHYFTFQSPAIPSNAQIATLQVYVRSRDVSTGSNSVRPAIKVNGTRYNTTAPSKNPGTGFTTYSYTYAVNPNTGQPWTAEDIIGTGPAPLQQIGVYHSDGNPSLRTSQVYAEVRYILNGTVSDIEFGISYEAEITATIGNLYGIVFPIASGSDITCSVERVQRVEANVAAASSVTIAGTCKRQVIAAAIVTSIVVESETVHRASDKIQGHCQITAGVTVLSTRKAQHADVHATASVASVVQCILQRSVVQAASSCVVAVAVNPVNVFLAGPLHVTVSTATEAHTVQVWHASAVADAVMSCDVAETINKQVVAAAVDAVCLVSAETLLRQYGSAYASIVAIAEAETTQISNNRIKYRVTHPVYGERVYEVIVTVLKSTENSILTYYFLASENSALADDVNALIQSGKIKASFPYGTDVSALVPHIEISPEASIDPGNGVAKDFTSPVLYTVVAESGAVQTYETQFTVLASGLNNMLSFRFLKVNNPLLSIDLDAVVSDASAIVLAPGSMTDSAIGALKPSIQVSEQAQIIPASLQERDFSETVMYEVTAQNGSKKTYRADLYRTGDIGGPSIPGSVTVFNDVLTMSGGGTGITGSSDKFHFLYRKMSGDCMIEAFVESMTNPGTEACAGIMLRSAIAANAKHAFLCQLQTVTDYQKPIQLRARSTTGGTTDTAYELYIDQTVKNGFRLVKSGSQIRAYSRRGESGTWYLRQTMALDLGTEFYAGIAVTSGTNAAACTVVVKGVQH